MNDKKMKVLHLILKKKWFDMIVSGEKLEEYRERKPYWDKRLVNRSYDAVQFRNGYSKQSPTILVELHGVVEGVGIREWGAPDKIVYILSLGRILKACHGDVLKSMIEKES